MPVSRISSTTYTPKAVGAYSERAADRLEGNLALIGESTGIQDILDISTSLDMPKIERVPNMKPLRSPFDEQSPEEDQDDSDAWGAGTIIHSVDGDIAEISAESMKRASSANLKLLVSE